MTPTHPPFGWLARGLALVAFLSACQNAPATGVPPDFRIDFERGPCFGTCPVYALTVGADGSVVYDGRQFVETQGERTASLTESQLQELVDAVRSTDFFGLADRYTVPATDLPSITLSVTMDGRTKTVDHYGAGCGTDFDTAPPELCDLEERVESIPISYGWLSSP